MEKTEKQVKPRKRSPRPKKTNIKVPAASARLKELWQDPVFREKQLAKHRAAAALRRGTDTFRTNVPDGMRKAEADKVWQEALESAQRTVEAMENNGVFDDVELDDSASAKEALKFNIATMRGKHDLKLRLQAAAKVLEYTKSKPVAKSEVTLNKAEEWLAQVSAQPDEQDKQDETVGDAEAAPE